MSFWKTVGAVMVGSFFMSLVWISIAGTIQAIFIGFK